MKKYKTLIIIMGCFLLMIILLIRPFIPTVMVSGKNGFEFERQVEHYDITFLCNLKKVLDSYDVFYFRIGKIIFVSTFLYYDDEAMWHYTEGALSVAGKHSLIDGNPDKTANDMKDK